MSKETWETPIDTVRIDNEIEGTEILHKIERHGDYNNYVMSFDELEERASRNVINEGWEDINKEERKESLEKVDISKVSLDDLEKFKKYMGEEMWRELSTEEKNKTLAREEKDGVPMEDGEELESFSIYEREEKVQKKIIEKKWSEMSEGDKEEIQRKEMAMRDMAEKKWAESGKEEQDEILNKERARLTKEKGIGLLTKEGIEKTIKVAKEKIRKLWESLDENEKAEIVISYSPTTWFGSKSMDWEEGYGNRAQQTAMITLEAIAEELQSLSGYSERFQELKEEGLSDKDARKKAKEDRSQDRIKISGFGMNKEIGEADIFWIADADKIEPGLGVAYIKELKGKYGKEDWWEKYYNSAMEIIDLKQLERLSEKEKLELKEREDLEILRKRVGAESPIDISNRIAKAINNIANCYNKILKKRGKESKSDKLIIWTITHGETARSLAQYGLGGKKRAKGFDTVHNEGYEIYMSGEERIVEFPNGKTYEVSDDEE